MTTKPKKMRDLLTIDDIDGRTQAARRASELKDSILNDPTEAWRQEQAENAAVLITIQRSLQLRCMKGEKISNDERSLVTLLTTVQNTVTRLAESFERYKASKDVSDLATFIREEAK